MKTTTYPGDHNSYCKYKHTDGKYYVRCLTTKTIDGVKYICTYRHKREDRHKQLIAAGRIHICTWEKENTPSKSLLDYYSPVEQKKEDKLDFSPEGLKQRLAYLIGKRNISIDAAASDEFYDFIIYCLSYGKQLTCDDGNIVNAAKKAYPHFKETALRNAVIQTAKQIKNSMAQVFSNLDYVAVAIDEGATFGEKNVSFNLENPLSGYDSYTIEILSISDVTANGYVSIIKQGLENISNLNIKIASCICDGNMAQKKAFSYQWKDSLRFKQPWMKEIIFIPCLCHKVNNAYKMVVNQNDDIRELVEEARSFAIFCKDHKEEIGATCPSFVSTRWIYDYDLVNFFLEHEEKIKEIAPKNMFPEKVKIIYPILKIFKTLIRIFEDSHTPFHRGFVYLERARTNFQELDDQHNPFSLMFWESLSKYTIHSYEGGLWVLAYLLTAQGQEDFFQRSHKLMDDKPVNALNVEKMKSRVPVDELEQTTEDMIANYIENNLAQEEEPEIPNDSVEPQDFSNESDQGQNADTSDHTTTQPNVICQNHNRPNSITISAENIDTYFRKIIGISADSDSSDEDFIPTVDEENFEFNSYLNSAKNWLLQYLQNINYSKKSIEIILREFNTYLDLQKPFKLYRTETKVGFAWSQIEKDFPKFSPIAKIARRLHSSCLSEASCERSISQQRMIFASRRRNSNRDLLDARLSIISSSFPQ